jgi:RNA polymerase-interacting CarD/CdnL/TRCF family regulator
MKIGFPFDIIKAHKMVGSLHRHKEAQALAGREFHLCDENFLRDAEKILSAEFSLVLDIAPGQVSSYVWKVMNEE